MKGTDRFSVNEIFYSLQGEGIHCGMPSVFIRFSGCNLRCPFCDTDFEHSVSMDAAQIADAVLKTLPEGALRAMEGGISPLIVLTGGEPSLQVNEALIGELRSRIGGKICIETNGTHPLPEGIDFVTCSPKEESEVLLKRADEVKVVFTGAPVEHWRTEISSPNYLLQPCSCANTAEVIGYILTHPWWRLSLQTHRYTGIR